MSESSVYERFKNLIKSQSYKVYTVYDIPIGTMLEISEVEWIVTNTDRKELLFIELYCVKTGKYNSMLYADLFTLFTRNVVKFVHVPEEIKE